MNRFRQYHRWLAIVLFLPLLTTVISGVGFTIARSLHQRALAEFLIHIHTLEIFGLGEVFPLLNGIGLFSLLITGIYMTRLFRQRRYLS
ncbi:MAG: peptidase [Myxacorys chilensis ATA2-1-KO14]|jgi:hypothetical protein|nr:peptidase [Myxacorys chilensis ATA2-1-KO14]